MGNGKFNKVAYNNKFNSRTYDRINLTMPKGEKERIRVRANAHGVSVNGYIKRLIEKDMQDMK